MAGKDDEVVVRITTSQRVFYDQTVRMKRSAWLELESLSGPKLENRDGPLSDRLDLRQVFTADDFEDTEMELLEHAPKRM